MTIEYIPGSKLIIQGTGGRPVITADPSLICRDIEFYNANGSLVWGTANCSTHMEDPNLTPKNIKAGTTIAGVRGKVIARPPDCSVDGSQDCVAAGDLKRGISIAGVSGNSTQQAVCCRAMSMMGTPPPPIPLALSCRI